MIRLEYIAQRNLLFALTLAIVFTPQSIFAQTTEQQKVNEMAKVYGYFLGQKYTVDYIKQEFPSSSVRLDLAILEWKTRFYPSIEYVIKYIETHHPADFIQIDQSIRKSIPDQIQPYLSALSINNIEGTISEIEARGKGILQSPFLELFLKYHPKYIKNPTLEYVDKYIQVYESNGSGKSKGLKLRFKVPLSWEKAEAERPNVIIKYSSNRNGEFSQFNCTVIDATQLMKDEGIKGATVESELSPELNQGFADDLVKDFGGTKASKVRNITIDNHPSLCFVYDMSMERAGNKVNAKAFTCLTFFRNYMIYFTMMVGSSEDPEKLPINVDGQYQLFNRMLNDIVILSQYVGN